jgi:hypothetical protein
MTTKSTDFAPALVSARAQASAVAPVVSTSSTRRMCFPATLARQRSGQTKAPATLRRRPEPDLPAWLTPARLRASAPGQ